MDGAPAPTSPRTGRALIAAALLALVLVAAGCAAVAGGAPGDDPRPAPRRRLLVSAASSLRGVLESATPAFERAHGVDVVLNLGASGVLARQVEAGAPADVFVSASREQVDALASGRLTSGEPSVVAENGIVLVVRRDTVSGRVTPQRIAGFRLLAIGDPRTTPHGAMAQAYLRSIGLWDRLAARVTYGATAEQTLAHVRSGEVDAGFVFASQAASSPDLSVALTVPDDVVPPSEDLAVPLAGSAEPALARAYAAHLRSPGVRRLFVAAGFRAPSSSSEGR